MIYVFLCAFISTVHASSLYFLGFSGSVELSRFPPLKFFFFFSFLAFLSKMTKRAKQVPEPASPSHSNSTSTSSPVPTSSPAPPPSASFSKSLYRWEPMDLLEETSTFTTLESIATYRKKQTCHPSRVFGKGHNKFVRIVACREGEPMCADEAFDPEGPFCFIYSTIFRRLGLQLPLTPFERILLTEVNVAPTQLHPNSWAFVRAFAILCYSLGFMPSVDTFLFFFEVKDPGKKMWVSFNGVAGRVLLTLFQQLYKGFKKNFFKVRSNRRDPALLDGFPLYWTEKPILQRLRSLEDLAPQERGVCEFLSGLPAPFSTLELLKHEFSPKSLKTYISVFSRSNTSCFISLAFSPCRLLPVLTCCLCVDMGFNKDKKKKLVDLLAKRRAAVVGEGTSTPVTPSTSVTSAPQPINPAPTVDGHKGVVVIESRL